MDCEWPQRYGWALLAHYQRLEKMHLSGSSPWAHQNIGGRKTRTQEGMPIDRLTMMRHDACWFVLPLCSGSKCFRHGVPRELVFRRCAMLSRRAMMQSDRPVQTIVQAGLEKAGKLASK